MANLDRGSLNREPLRVLNSDLERFKGHALEKDWVIRAGLELNLSNEAPVRTNQGESVGSGAETKRAARGSVLRECQRLREVHGGRRAVLNQWDFAFQAHGQRARAQDLQFDSGHALPDQRDWVETLNFRLDNDRD